MSAKGQRNRGTRPQIPAFAQKLLHFLLPQDKRDILFGDFVEGFLYKEEEKGAFRARLWFWGQILASLPSFVRFRMRFTSMMMRSYMTIAFRHLYRQAGYSFLNLAGLAVGIACFAVIMVYVQNERSFDQFHPNAERTYRLLDFRKVDGIGEESSSAPLPLADAMRLDYPEQVEAIVRFFNFQAPTLTVAFQPAQGELRQFNEPRFFFADPDIFRVFDFPLSQGNAATALNEPNSVVITQAMARKYFSGEDPIGKVLRFEDKHDLQVTGVFDDLPQNTHLEFDFIASFSTLNNPEVIRPLFRDSYEWNPAWTYLVLHEGVDPKAFEAQLPAFVNKHFFEEGRDIVKLYLQPLTDIHLHSKLDYEMHANSDVAYVYVFTTVAVFILLISCFNFINLTTARSTHRAREIGMRKILGGYRAQLVSQFLSESVLTSFLALLLSLPIMWLLLRLLNGFSGGDLSLDLWQRPEWLLGLIGLSGFIGVVSGIYPAFFLSAYRPAQAVKGARFVEVTKGILFRKVLVIGQFSLSIILIVGTFIAIKQLHFLQSRSLGFDQQKVVLLPTLRSPLMDQYQSFKGRLLQNPNVQALTVVEEIPGAKHQTGEYKPEGFDQVHQFPRLIVHDDFAAAMGIDMAAGRDFLPEFAASSGGSMLINEATVELLGWGSADEAVGKKINNGTVVGVMKDFHFTSLHKSIGPIVIARISDNPMAMSFIGRYIAIRLNMSQLEETMNFIEEEWYSFTPNRPFEYLFLDELLGNQYEAEATLGKVAGSFAVLSVLIACLGLFGLASFTTERRIKEIGIRKVLGAPVLRLVYMLSASFIKLVLLAILIASPVAYFALNSWLADFAYRTSIGIWPFISSGCIALVIVLLTVSYQTIKAAATNPVKSLRYE